MIENKITLEKKVPISQAMFELFGNLMLSWSGLNVRRINPGEYLIPSMSMEIGLMFAEPEAGILVFRSSKNLERLLEKASSTIKPRESRLGYFKEVIVLFWSDFVSKYLGLDSRKIKKPLFKYSTPENWPKRTPNAQLAVLVENELLEIRIWSSLLPGDIENWTKIPNDLGLLNLKRLF